MGVRKLPSAPLPLPLLSRSPTVCFCMWEAVRIFHVTYMKKLLEESFSDAIDGVGVIAV